MIRLLLRPPHFQCDSPAEAAKLARIIRISSDAPLIEVVDGESAKTKRCAKCKTTFSTVAHADRASRFCKSCRPKPARWAAKRAPRLRKSAAPSVPAPVTVAAPVAPRKPAFSPKHGPVSCLQCGATVPEFESINGLCLECAPMGDRKAS